MSAVVVRIEPEQIERDQGVVAWFREFAAECLREANILAHERIKNPSPGGYQTKFAVELLPGSPPSLLFGNTSDHAIYVEEDTDAHTVVPKDAQALRWFDPPGGGAGSEVFSMFAKIPARKGKHIVRDAVSRAGARLRGV